MKDASLQRDFYLFARERKGGKPVWYAKFRDPKTREIQTAVSTGQTSETSATNWAKRKMRELEEKAKAPPGSLLPLRAWAETFFGDRCPHAARLLPEGRPLSPRNQQINRQTLGKYLLPDPIMDLPIGEIRRADLLQFRQRTVARYGMRKRSQRAFAVLKIILREAVFQEIIDRDPTSGIGLIKVEAKPRTALTMEQLRLLLDPERFAEPLHYEGTACAAMTGMRAGEVRALWWGDLDPVRGIIRVVRNLPGESTELVKPKWRKTRISPYPKALQAILEPRRGGDSEWVFSFYRGGPMGYKLWARAAKSAGKSAGFPVSLHILRHTLNTLLRERGIADEKLRGAFGWSGAAIQDNYTHRENYDYTPLANATDQLMGGSLARPE